MLLLSNNKLSRIAENLGTNFPKLEQLVMSNNDFAQLADLDNLCTLSTLKSLSLVDNSVTKLPDYRAYVLHLLPKLRVLDFTKVKQKEVEAAISRFGAAGSGRGEKQAAAAGAKRARAESEKTAAQIPDQPAGPMLKAPKAAEPALPPELVAAAREALANAESLEEVQRLERALKSRNADALRAVLSGAAEVGAPAPDEMEQ